MATTKKQLIIKKEDYDILMSYLTGLARSASFNRENAEILEEEIKKAKLVKADKFPGNVIGLNSLVKIKDENSGKIMELSLVTPDKADIKQRKVSVMAPIGAALIGFQQGHQVSWEVPSGKKKFTILEVYNA